MHGLPPNANLDFLLSRTLIQVGFGANDLALNFDQRVRIVVTSEIGMRLGARTIERNADFRSLASPILSLLDRPVGCVRSSEDGTLILGFGLDQLVLYDNSDIYESYVIYNGPDVVVV